MKIKIHEDISVLNGLYRHIENREDIIIVKVSDISKEDKNVCKEDLNTNGYGFSKVELYNKDKIVKGYMIYNSSKREGFISFIEIELNRLGIQEFLYIKDGNGYVVNLEEKTKKELGMIVGNINKEEIESYIAINRRIFTFDGRKEVLGNFI